MLISMNFRIQFVIMLLLLSKLGVAQETAPNYLMYRYNMNILNPAYAGVSDKSEIALGIRKQSMDLQDDATTQYASFSQGVGEKMGLGVSIVNDKVFISKQTDVVIDASYELQINNTTNLYFGMKAGGAFYAVDFNSLGENDPVFNSNVSTFSPSIGVGAYLKSERYFLNISMPNLVLNEIQKPTIDANGNANTDGGVTEKFHMYLGGGYKFTVSESIDVTPTVFSRFVTDDSVLVDVSAIADYEDIIEAGLTYRLDTSVLFSVYLKILDRTHFGYAYEATTSEYSNISSGTHEFVVRFQW